MRRYLVVAHQTLSSPELLEEMTSRAGRDEASFHLLVPIYHGEPGLTWTEGHDRGVAHRRLDEAVTRLTAAGLTVTGEVGTDSPVESVDDVLKRDGAGAFDEIIVSTLPRTVSKWLKIDAPSRIQRKTSLPVHHVIGHPAEVSA
jgi:GABA permease